jgi:hypothetical protein
MPYAVWHMPYAVWQQQQEKQKEVHSKNKIKIVFSNNENPATYIK